MARGWESKSVEEQMENSREPAAKNEKGKLSPQELEDLRRREVLALSIARVRSQLETATEGRYREQLLSALASLERQLGEHSG